MLFIHCWTMDEDDRYLTLYPITYSSYCWTGWETQNVMLNTCSLVQVLAANDFKMISTLLAMNFG